MARVTERLGKTAMVPLWSSGFIVGVLATRHAGALTVNFWRFAAAAPLMVAIAMATRSRWPRTRAEILPVAAAGLLLGGVQFTGNYLSLEHDVPAALVALLAGTSPLLVAILAWPLLGEHLEPRQWLGSLIGVAGVVFAVAEGLRGTVTGVGLMFALLGLAGLTAGTLVQRRYGSEVDPRASNAIQLGVAGVAMAPIAAVTQGFHVPLTFDALAPIAWLTLVLSLVAVLIFFSLLRRENSGEATSFLYLVPSFTALAAVPILGQPLSPGAVVGLALGLLGVRMVSRRAPGAHGEDQERARDVRPAASPRAAQARGQHDRRCHQQEERRSRAEAGS
jgi:drug/metabolite transporter (DMT)-like permease